MGIDHVVPGNLGYIFSSAVGEQSETDVASALVSLENQSKTLVDESWLHDRWSHVEIGTSAIFRKRRRIADSVMSRILSSYPLPLVYAVERRSGLALLEPLDYGDAVQIAAEYVVYNGLHDGEWPLYEFALNSTDSTEQATVIEGMLRSIPSVYEVVHERNGRSLVVRNLMAESGQESHLLLYTDSERTRSSLRTHTLFTGRIVRFQEMAMPLGLLLSLSMDAAELLACNLSRWATGRDHTTTSHRAIAKTLHEYCIRAYLEDPARRS